MAIVRKTDVIQVRCLPGDLAAFEAACRLVDIKPTERIRQFMVAETEIIQRRAANNAAWHAALAAKAARVSPAPKKPLVEPVRQPQSLSERRRLEKAAKELRKAKKDDRY